MKLPSRIVIFGVFLGLLVLLLGGILRVNISTQAYLELARITSPTQWQMRLSQEPFPNYYLLLSSLGVLTSLVAGAVTGFVIGKKGEFYGAVLGVSAEIISFVGVILLFLFAMFAPVSFIYGPGFPADLAHTRSTQQFLDGVRSIPKGVPSTALLIIETAIGGYFGSKLRQRSKSRKFRFLHTHKKLLRNFAV
jgi:hypothetical protein